MELRAVTKRYRTWRGRETLALNRVDLVVGEGQIHVLLGPNGSGKSTTMVIALGLTAPSAGEVRTLGLAPRRATRARRVGYLPENYVPLPGTTARGLLRMLARVGGKNGLDAKTRALCSMLEIDAFADRPVAKLSKGMRQRLGIAQALLDAPELLILDEPMSGLDPRGRGLLRAQLRRSVRDGVAVVLSTHDLADAAALADVVSIYRNGRIVRRLDLRDGNVSESTIVRVGASRARVQQALANAAPSAAVSWIDDQTFRVDVSRRQTVLAALVGAGVEVLEMHAMRTKTLEQAYLEVHGP